MNFFTLLFNIQIMKRVIILFLLMTAFAWQGHSQQISKHAIGLRFGNHYGLGPEINYQHGLRDNNRLEFGFAWHTRNHYSGIKLTGIYQWVWNIEDGFNWYAGPGAGVGMASYREGYYADPRRTESNGYIYATGDVGIEYNFDIPLIISLDVRPQINFNYHNNLTFDFGLSARYQF